MTPTRMFSDALEDQQAPALVVGGGPDRRDDAEDPVDQHIGREEPDQGQDASRRAEEGDEREDDGEDAAKRHRPPVLCQKRLMAWVRSKESEEPVVPVAMDVLLRRDASTLTEVNAKLDVCLHCAPAVSQSILQSAADAVAVFFPRLRTHAPCWQLAPQRELPAPQADPPLQPEGADEQRQAEPDEPDHDRRHDQQPERRRSGRPAPGARSR